jgi:hypothetical protein
LSCGVAETQQCPAWKECAGDLPVALEAVKRIDALFDIERNINGLSAGSQLA